VALFEMEVSLRNLFFTIHLPSESSSLSKTFASLKAERGAMRQKAT
jgi:hypothetical protein